MMVKIKRVAAMILCCIVLLGICSCGQESTILNGEIESSGGFKSETQVDVLPGTEEDTGEVETESEEPWTAQEAVEEWTVQEPTEEETEPVIEEGSEPLVTSAGETETSELEDEIAEPEEETAFSFAAMEEIQGEPTLVYPLTYSDESCSIVIEKVWFEDAWVYAAHLQFTDYSRLSTDCANGSYDNGYETTSHAAGRLGAVYAVNGCYSAPYLNYTVVRDGVIWNGSERNLWLPAVYSSQNGLLLSAWETGGVPGIAGVKVSDLVAGGLVTDTFCFGPPGLQNGVVTDVSTTGARAQRTFVGTNGEPGDIWICVSDGRYNDGESAGLLGNQCMRFLQSKGCAFGVNLDGGGSSTMYFNGEVLNAARGNERAVVDFLYFK